MTDLKNQSDSHLIERTKNLVAQERSITAQVIEHLEEIDRRKLHLERPRPDQTRPVSQTQTQISFTADKELMQDLLKLDPQARQSVVAPKVGAELKRAIPASVRAAVWKRDQGKCQFVDPVTQRACHSRFMLELDHAIPFAQGGVTTSANLRLRCQAHHQLHAAHSYGTDKMARHAARRC